LASVLNDFGVIAVVDPDPVWCATVAELLAGAGFRVTSFSVDSPELGLEAGQRPGLLIAGPGTSGSNALLLAKDLAMRDGSFSPDVLVVGAVDSRDRLNLLEAGAICAMETNVMPAEVAAQAIAVVRQRRMLMGEAGALRTSHGMLAQLQDDLQLGARIQASFLPPLSISTPTFALEARIQAGWTLSGDFFDYKFITPERLAVFIADISGHGVASALLASRLKAFFDEHYRNARRPARTLEQLNRMLIELGEHQQFATAVLLCLDIAEGSLIYANAGHRTLYLLDREQGHYTPLPSSGPALGLFEDCEIGERDFNFLPRRKRLVAYTDGLIEFKHQQREDWVSEEEFVEQLILPALTLGIGDFADAVFKGSPQLSGGDRWEDDVCLVVVDY
jgi:serine phosphatase RsbU (regulator of sigma subunit)